jgi:hypothetical protein
MRSRAAEVLAGVLACVALSLRGAATARADSGDPWADDGSEVKDTAHARHRRAQTIREPRDGFGLQVDFSGGLGQDGSSVQTYTPEYDGRLAFVFGMGTAVLFGPLTAGLRVELAPVLLDGGENRYYLADVGGHARIGSAKLTGVAEVGAHQFIDVSRFLGPTSTGSTFLPSVGARASLDIVSVKGPTIGWWFALHYDVGEATVAPFRLGGVLVASGLEIGFDSQGLR